jgi:hypothetical protein
MCVYILTVFYISQVLLHVSMHLHYLQGALFFYFAKVTKIIMVTDSTKSVIITVDTAHKLLWILFCHRL